METEQTKETEKTPTDLMNDVVQSVELEYQEILQRWMKQSSLPNDDARMRVCCEQLGIPVSQIRIDKEILVKAKSLEPEIAKKDDAFAKRNSFADAYEKRKAIFDEYSSKEIMAISELNQNFLSHDFIWHRAMDAENQLAELKKKHPRAFGLKVEPKKVAVSEVTSDQRDYVKNPMTVSTVKDVR